MDDSKKFWESKTFWTNVLGIGAMVAQSVSGSFLLPPEWQCAARRHQRRTSPRHPFRDRLVMRAGSDCCEAFSSTAKANLGNARGSA